MPDVNKCGTCTQCCKTLKIKADDGSVLSEYGTWCPLVDIGVGCRDYGNRPKVCREFACLWLQSQDRPEPERLPLALRPDKTKVVLVVGESSVVAHVDVHRPNAYREGLLGEYLRRMGERLVVTAKIGDRGVAIGSKAKQIILDRIAKDGGVGFGMNPEDAATILAAEAGERKGPA